MSLPSLFSHSPEQTPHLTLFKRVQNRPFQKVNYPGISRIIFPTRKGTGSKQKDSNKYRFPFHVGNLQNCLEQWTKITNNPLVLNAIQGHRIQFHTQPPIQPAPDLKYLNISPQQEYLIDLEVQSLLEKGAVTKVNPKSPGSYSRIFQVPKEDGGQRPVINLRPWNQFVDKKTFKMDTLKSVKEILGPEDWAVTLDIKDAYFRLPIHMKSRKFFRFLWRKKAFQFVVLLFDLSSAPRVFTLVFKALIQFCRRKGIRVIVFLDDIFVLGRSYRECLQNRDQVLKLLRQLGFQLNHKKSFLIPSQVFFLYGPPMEHQNNASFPSIGKDSRFETNSTANSFQNPDNLSSGHEVHREGKSCGSSHSRSTSAFQNFSEAIDFHLLKSVQPFQVVHSFRDGQRGSYLVGKPKRILLHNVPSRTTSTDSGRIRCIPHMVGCHSRESTFESHLEQGGHSSDHINELEMLAGENALHHYCPKIQGKVVQVKCDNSTVVHYLKNQGGTKSFSLCDMVLRILNWCLVNRVTVLPLNIKGEYHLIPDAFCRQKILQDWHLRPNITRRIFLRHGLPHKDLFATKLSSQCPFYMTWKAADMEAIAIDALRQQWIYNLVYAFPPIPLIPLVLKKLEQFPFLKILLVVPAWPQNPGSHPGGGTPMLGHIRMGEFSRPKTCGWV